MEKIVGNIENEQYKRAFFYLSLGYTKDDLINDHEVLEEDLLGAESLKEQGWTEGSSFTEDDDKELEIEYLLHKSQRYNIAKYEHDTETLYIVKRKTQ